MSNSDQVKSQEVSNQEHLPQVLTVDEAAKLLRVGVGRLKSAFKKGEIPGGRRMGRHLRFHREALLRWLREGTSTVETEQPARQDDAKDRPANADAYQPCDIEELNRQFELAHNAIHGSEDFQVIQGELAS